MSTNPTAISFPLYVDSSMLTTWRACRRKHYWSTLRSLYPMGKSVHLIAGGAFAGGIEAARRACFSAPIPEHFTLEELAYAALPPFARLWGDFVPEERSSKTFDNTFNALVHYLEHYHPGTDELQPMLRPDGSPAVEYKFAVPIDGVTHPETGDPILFSGRFDMVGTLNGVPCIVDEKTTGSLGFNWADKWDLRGQFLGYIWALRKQGIDVSHAVINGIAILKTKNEIQRAVVKYPEHMIARWEAQMTADIMEMIRSYKHFLAGVRSFDTTYTYNFADSCESYGGCAFAVLCGARDPEPFTSNYIKYRYDPLSVTPVEEVAA